jgi:serine/threonine-protein kinase RsbT
VGEAQVPTPNGHEPVADLVPVIRRVVAARIRNPAQVDDIVQETLSRVLAARSRVEGDTLVPYAVATARNLIASAAQREQRARQLAHLLAEPGDEEPRPEDEADRRADAALVNTALGRLAQTDRELLLAHEVEGKDTAALAADRVSTGCRRRPAPAPAPVRVEYLLAQRAPTPDRRCRPTLLALSSADRRRQAELDVPATCWPATSARTSAACCSNAGRRAASRTEAVPVARDANVVVARQKAREVAVRAVLGTDLTLIATAVSRSPATS